MSFSFGAIAANKAHAKAIVAKQVPGELHSVVNHAIDKAPEGPISLQGHGHIPTGADWSTLQLNIVVEPMQVLSTRVANGALIGDGERQR